MRFVLQWQEQLKLCIRNPADATIVSLAKYKSPNKHILIGRVVGHFQSEI